ncbi:hypothetical protein EVAR_98981_1 [Eumeta japonica]|uniref:Uncharacterized protein n=1 Tax=Eumeta variegata TaxID=151549 RepID=A0A4C1YN01_EUMVA|nr:hypothetical protein EVAR_98981_1 [Eumeta japonica]
MSAGCPLTPRPVFDVGAAPPARAPVHRRPFFINGNLIHLACSSFARCKVINLRTRRRRRVRGRWARGAGGGGVPYLAARRLTRPLTIYLAALPANGVCTAANGGTHGASAVAGAEFGITLI